MRNLANEIVSFECLEKIGEECIFVGLSCAVSRSVQDSAETANDRPTDLFFRLNTLCTHISGTNLSI